MVCESLVCLSMCILCLRVLRVVSDVLLHGLSIAFLFVCVLLFICLRDAHTIYCVHVYGLWLC